MLIPITTGSQNVSEEVRITESGTLVCPTVYVSYDGSDYLPGDNITVVKGGIVTLTTTIQENKTHNVLLNGFKYIWSTVLDNDERYIDKIVHKDLTGTTYANLVNITENKSMLFSVGGVIGTQDDAIVTIDYVKRDVWIHGVNGGVKKLTFTEDVVGAVFTPSWAQFDNVVTEHVIVTEHTVHYLDNSYNIVESFEVPAAIKAVTGYSGGNIVLCFDRTLEIYRKGETISTVSSSLFSNNYAAFTVPDDSIIVSSANGIVLVYFLEGLWRTEMLITGNGLYLSFDISETHLYVIDQLNKELIQMRTGDRTTKRIMYVDVPKEVVYNTATNTINVFYYDKNMVTVYDNNLDVVESRIIPSKCYGATEIGGILYVTSLYSDGNQLTLKVEAKETDFIQGMVNIPQDVIEPSSRRVSLMFDRTEYVRVESNRDVLVLVDNIPFTEGYLLSGTEVNIEVPYNETHYSSTVVNFISAEPKAVWFRVEPRLYPFTEVVPEVLEAFPRFEYIHTYTVQGITEGFTGTMSYEGSEVLVRLADTDSDFTPYLEVKSGDVVEVRAVIRNLFSKRVPHEYFSYKSNVALTWTLLPMLLSGTSVRSETEVKVNKFAHLTGMQQQVAGFLHKRVLRERYTTEHIHWEFVGPLLNEYNTIPNVLTNYVVRDYDFTGEFRNKPNVYSYDLNHVFTKTVIESWRGYTSSVRKVNYHSSELYDFTRSDVILKGMDVQAEYGYVHIKKPYRYDYTLYGYVALGLPSDYSPLSIITPHGNVHEQLPIYVKIIQHLYSLAPEYEAISKHLYYIRPGFNPISKHLYTQGVTYDTVGNKVFLGYSSYSVEGKPKLWSYLISDIEVIHPKALSVRSVDEYSYYDVPAYGPYMYTHDYWAHSFTPKVYYWKHSALNYELPAYRDYATPLAYSPEYKGAYEYSEFVYIPIVKHSELIGAEYLYRHLDVKVIKAHYGKTEKHLEYVNALYGKTEKHLEDIAAKYGTVRKHYEACSATYIGARRRFEEVETSAIFHKTSYGNTIQTPEISGLGGTEYAEAYAQAIGLSSERIELKSDGNGKFWFVVIPNNDSVVCDVNELPEEVKRIKFGFYGGG